MLSYALTELPPPFGFPADTNVSANQIKGGYVAGTAQSPYLKAAVRWDGVVSQQLLTKATGYGVNANGDVVGTMSPDGNKYATAFVYADGDLTLLNGPLGAIKNHNALAVNVHRMLVGMIDGGGIDVSGPDSAFTYDAKNGGAPTLIPTPAGFDVAYAVAINDVGEVLCWCEAFDLNDFEHNHALIFRPGEPLQDLGTVFAAGDINVHGVVVGHRRFDPQSMVHHAFRLDASAGTPAEDLGAPTDFSYSEARAINDDGVIVGTASKTYGGEPPMQRRAHVYVPEGDDAGWHALSNLTNDNGWTLEVATSIDNDGTIVGYGRYGGYQRGFRLQPVTTQSIIEAKVGDFVSAFIMMFGGAEKGGAGVGVTPGGIGWPIPPHGPRILSPEVRDAAIGMALDELANGIDNRVSREQLRRTAEDIVERAVANIRSARRA
jgi:probable HAF family extracellular repeat protein